MNYIAFDCHRRYTFARVEKGDPEADHGGASTYNQEDQPYTSPGLSNRAAG